MKEGEVASCSICSRESRIDTPILEIFDSEVAFGPDGPRDMFIEEDNGTVKCQHCSGEEPPVSPI